MSDGPDDPEVLSVASSISAGEDVEWDRLQRKTVGADDEIVMRELRVIEDIARFHRGGDEYEHEHELEAEVARPLTWGHFAIVEQVGAGVFGAVYRAIDQKLQSEVALKLLPSAEGIDASRALREARLLARVRHANVVRVHGADNLEGRVGIWMEFVKGHTLEELLRTHGRFGAREAAFVGLDVCRALAAVHRAGLMHGDVKAHNVMREEGGRTVLMDFGTGKDLGTDRSATRVGQADLAGTPLYLAPEVFDGQPRTKAADIYGLGVLLYHLVTQAYPVEGATVAAVRQAHRRGQRSRLRDVRPDLPDAFVQIVERALAPLPQERWPTAGAFEAEIARFLGARAEALDTRRTKIWAVIASGVGALIVVGAFGYWLADRHRSGSPTESVVQSTAVATPAAAGPVEGAYTIDAAVYRERDGREDRLRPNASVQPGDRLSLQLQASTPTHVYVVNEDDRGASFLLFPLPGQALTNPLPAGSPTRLPGDRDGTRLYWQVTSAGGREHFLIFASPEPMAAFERMFAALPRPALHAPVESAPLSHDDVGLLRGVGGLVSRPAQTSGDSRLTERFTTELAQTAETAHGLWVRQITFVNPPR